MFELKHLSNFCRSGIVTCHSNRMYVLYVLLCGEWKVEKGEGVVFQGPADSKQDEFTLFPFMDNNDYKSLPHPGHIS